MLEVLVQYIAKNVKYPGDMVSLTKEIVKPTITLPREFDPNEKSQWPCTSKKVHRGTYWYPVSVEPEIFPGTRIHLCVGSRSAGSGGCYLGNAPLIDKNFSLGKISSGLNEMSVFLYNVSLFNGSGRTKP